MTLLFPALVLTVLLPLDPADRAGATFDARCGPCHALDEHRVGPRLRGVFGRRSASLEDYPYSDALRAANLVWDAATLDRWLADPDALVPGNDMHVRRASNAKVRALLIEYLEDAGRASR